MQQAGNPAVAELLIQHGAVVDAPLLERNFTPLCVAHDHGSSARLGRLSFCFSDAHMRCVVAGQEDTVGKVLVQHGASQDILQHCLQEEVAEKSADDIQETNEKR